MVTSSSTENDILTERLYDIHSSKWNTDYLNQAQTAADFPAAKMCYDITIDGKHAQLPNVQTLAFVYSKKDYVDANDPTAPSNPAKKLSNWGFGNSTVCSSTAGDSISRVVALDLNGIASAQTDRMQYFGVIPILEIPLYKDRTGERVDNKATIAGKLGNDWVAVLDAAYRGTALKWGKYGTDLSGLINVTGTYTVGDGWEEAAILSQTCKDTQTSKQNTDYLKTQNTGTDSQSITGVPAAAHCFGISISGTTAQLPNAQTGAFGFANKSFIDRFDPTAAANPTKAMAAIGTYWTSSEDGSDGAYCVESDGFVYVPSKGLPCAVCPALEIPLWCDDNYQ